MKLITFLIAALLTASNLYAVDRLAGQTFDVDGTDYTCVPIGRESWSDYVIGANSTIFTFRVNPSAEAFGVYARPIVPAAGTDLADSLRFRYRPLASISDQTLTTGSELIPLNMRSSTGTNPTWIDWTTGVKYFAYDSTGVLDFSTIGARWIEIRVEQCITVAATDSVYVTIDFVQFPLPSNTVR
jgi:hypothetical protein